MQLQRGLAAEAQRLWLQQAFDNSSGLVSGLQREVAATLTALGEIFNSSPQNQVVGRRSSCVWSLILSFLRYQIFSLSPTPADPTDHFKVAASLEVCSLPAFHAFTTASP